MIYKLNNKGIGLPTVLGIVTFVIAVATTLLIVAVSQAQLVDKSFERTEAYANAVQAVDATAKIIARDQNLERTYLDGLEDEMGVTIEPYSLTSSVYVITSMVTSTRIITSYLTGSASSVDTYTEIFQNTGQEPNFDLSPLATPATLLSAYLPDFYETNFWWMTLQSDFTNITEMVAYIRTLALANSSFEYHSVNELVNQWDPTPWWHWYVDGNVTIPDDKNLTIPNDRLLVIDGNLSMGRNSTLTGNVVVNGSFTINGEFYTRQYLYGTVYAAGAVTINTRTNLGTSSRPSFIFTEGNVSLNSYITGYGYFFSNDLTSNYTSTYITGGVYTTEDPELENDVISNSFLDSNLFYHYAVPSSISVETETLSELDVFDNLFKFTGQETDFDLAELMITPAALLSAYLPDFYEANFWWMTLQSDFTSITEMVAYIRTLAEAETGYEFYDDSLNTKNDQTVWWHWFIDGNVSIPNKYDLTIPDDRLLVIDGNLSMGRNSTLTGNVVVNGSFTINGGSNSRQYLYGTVYAAGAVTINTQTRLGTSSRPSFVFSEGNVSLNSYITGYGYFLSTDLTSNYTSTNITGGVYTTEDPELENDVIPNNFLDSDLFYHYAVPTTVFVVVSGGSEGTGIFKFTFPKLN